MLPKAEITAELVCYMLAGDLQSMVSCNVIAVTHGSLCSIGCRFCNGLSFDSIF